MNELKITAAVRKALTEVEAGNVTFSYRSAPKIKGTRLVKAVSREWLNTKIASGITNAMLAKLFDAELVKGHRSTYGIYGVSLTAKGLEVLAATKTPVPADGPVEPLTSTITDVIAAKAVELTDARLELAQSLNNAAIAARTSVSAKALADAGAFVLMGRDEEARKALVPLRTRAALAAIAAIKAL